MKQITLKDRARYSFDNYMAMGTGALVLGLFVLSALVVILASAIIVLGGITQDGGDPLRFGEVAWEAMMRTLDAGTMGGDTGWAFRLVMFGVTIGGVFVISSLIGVISNGVEGKMERLRKGRSFVLEQRHIVILGWSPQVFSILSELVLANENQKKACVAILAEKDKVEMEDEIREKIPKLENTRVVCRTGSPMDLIDLEIVSPHRARAIIVLRPESDDPDAEVIKTILALTNNPHRRRDPYHIVASISDPKNLEAARLVGGQEAQIILADELISRITAQTCRQSGLSTVCTELLDFKGDEIYFQEEPALVGLTFGEALFRYEDSALIGLCSKMGGVKLNPPMDAVIAPGDQVIAISEDDDTVLLSGLWEVPVDQAAIHEPQERQRIPERTLILGWNSRGPLIINELDRYVAPGSRVQVVADDPGAEQAICAGCEALQNQTAAFIYADTTSRRVLDSLAVETFHHVIILSDSPRLPTQQADACTLVTLLHLRDIAEKCGHPFSIVSEMLDLRNRELAEVARVDDFIVSNRLVSLMLSQVSENKELMAVFDDLFNAEGAEIYLKPAEDYVCLDQAVNFYTVVAAARRRSEVAIGYRRHTPADSVKADHGVTLNPKKSEKIRFEQGDRIILLAEA